MLKQVLIAGILSGSFFHSNLQAATKLTAQLKQEIAASEKAGSKVKSFASERLIHFINNPVLIKAVKEQNAKCKKDDSRSDKKD